MWNTHILHTSYTVTKYTHMLFFHMKTHLNTEMCAHTLWTTYLSRFINLTELQSYWSSVSLQTDQMGTNQTHFPNKDYTFLFTVFTWENQGDKIGAKVISPSHWKLFITWFFCDDIWQECLIYVCFSFFHDNMTGYWTSLYFWCWLKYVCLLVAHLTFSRGP